MRLKELTTTKRLNTVITNGVIRIEIPLNTIERILGYQKKRDDKKRILDEVRGMWRDRKEVDALEYQKNIRSEWS